MSSIPIRLPLNRCLLPHLDEFFTDRINKKVAAAQPSLEARGLPPIRIDRGAPRDLPPRGLVETYKTSLNLPDAHIYSAPPGELFLKKAIASYMGRRFGVDFNPQNEICALPGSNVGLFWILREISEEGPVLLPAPGYPTYYSGSALVKHNVHQLLLSPENNFTADLEQAARNIPSKITALVINYPHNPTGAVASLDYLKSVVDFARRHGSILISDLAYSEIYSPGPEKPHSIFEIEGAKDVAIEFHSLSKTFAITGFRSAFACGNPEIIEYLRQLMAHVTIGNIPIPLQYASAFALTDSSCAEYIARMNLEYSQRRKIVHDGLSETGWRPSDSSKGGFYIWSPIPESGTDSYKFFDRLLNDTGVVIVPGEDFGVEGRKSVRISLVQPQDKLAEAISRLKKAS